MWEYNQTDLYHHGILGMKWGVRRYQNKDGTLTNAGKKRKKLSPEPHDDYKKVHDKKSVKNMSDAELRSRLNRLQMERQYDTMTKKTNVGKKIFKGIIASAGTLAAAETAYKTYKRFGDNAVDKIGDWIMKDLAEGLSKGFG